MLDLHKLLSIVGIGVVLGGLPTIAIAQDNVTLSGESLNVEERNVGDFRSVWLDSAPVTTLEADTSAAFIDPAGVRVNLNNQVEYIQREGVNTPNSAYPFMNNQPLGNQGQVRFILSQ